MSSAPQFKVRVNLTCFLLLCSSLRILTSQICSVSPSHNLSAVSGDLFSGRQKEDTHRKSESSLGIIVRGQSLGFYATAQAVQLGTVVDTSPHGQQGYCVLVPSSDPCPLERASSLGHSVLPW